MGSKLSFLQILWTLSLGLIILPRSHSSSSEDDDDADLGIDDAVYLDTIETALDGFLSFPRMAVEEVSLAVLTKNVPVPACRMHMQTLKLKHAHVHFNHDQNIHALIHMTSHNRTHTGSLQRPSRKRFH